jgi:hypothetical protein
VTPAESALKAAFDAFTVALSNADAAAYRALIVTDAASQEPLFLRNAEKLRASKWAVKLRTLEIQGEVGDVTFEIVDAKGMKVDDAKAIFTLEGNAWKLRAL